MKKKNLWPVWATVLAITPCSYAQDVDDEDIIELSPFVVSPDDDEGYAASFVTSGSRIRTDLRDVAASVSVLTDEFMNDLAATDVSDAIAFVAGAENDLTTHQENIAGLGSANGYVGGDFGDNNNRSGVIRVRGLGRATTTQDFFEVIGSTDRYNTDRTEFLRGANSILFGIAEPAGLVNSSTKAARLRKNEFRLETKFDDLGTQRYVLDANVPVLKDKFGVRAVGLYEDQRYQINSAFQRDRRFYVTATFKPFKNTTLRVYTENISLDARRPNNRTVQDNVSDWLTKYNTYAPQLAPEDVAAAFFWDPTLESNRGAPPTASTASNVITLGDGSTVELGGIRRPLDTRANATVFFYDGENGQWQDPINDRVTLTANRRTIGSNPAAATQQFFVRSGSARENNPLFRADPQVTDKGIFPYDSVEIGALPGSYRWEKGRRYFASLEQRITKDFYISASYGYEDRQQEQYFAVITQTNQISLDINTRLPDGSDNPNFLRPFVYGRNLGEYNEGDSTNYTIQANYDLNFDELFDGLGWLGRHRLTALHTAAENERFGYRWNYVFDSNIPALPLFREFATLPLDLAEGEQPPLAANNATSANRQIMQIWYVGDPVQLGDTSLRFTGFPTDLAAQHDRSYDYYYFNDTDSVWETSPDPLSTSRQLSNGGRSYTIQENDGIGLSLQSFFWKDRLVTLFGWRKDNVTSVQFNPASINIQDFPTVPGVTRDDYNPNFANTFDNSTETQTQSIVFKLTNNIRFFANRSENFAATQPRQDNLYRFIDPASGETREFGIGLSFLEDKLNVRFTQFKSSQNNITSSTGVAGLRVDAFENVLYLALERSDRLGEWFTVGLDGGTTTERYERPNNAATTEDSVSEGYTVEVSFKPNRNWNILASFDQLENVTTGVGSELFDFLSVRLPYYSQFFAQDLRTDGSSTLSENGPTASQTEVLTRFIDTIGTNFANEIASEGTSNQGIAEYTAKLVARYKFREGRLNGLTIGANMRWESGKVIGNVQTIRDLELPGLPEGAPPIEGPVSDPSQQLVGESIIAGGAFVTYETKIFNGKVNWRLQLNAQNIFNSERGLRVIAANSDGSPVYGVAQPVIFELSNNFRF